MHLRLVFVFAKVFCNEIFVYGILNKRQKGCTKASKYSERKNMETERFICTTKVMIICIRNNFTMLFAFKSVPLSYTPMKKYFTILIVSLLIKHSVSAQFSSVLVSVDGLTCAACSYATQKSILQLDFVKDVQMDLNTHVATITFKEGKKVSVDLIAKKVFDAGFSVGSLYGIFNFKSIAISNNYCFNYEGDNYDFIQVKDQKLNGEVKIKFAGDRYMRKKELKKWTSLLKGNCSSSGNSKFYYVTIE